MNTRVQCQQILIFHCGCHLVCQLTGGTASHSSAEVTRDKQDTASERMEIFIHRAVGRQLMFQKGPRVCLRHKTSWDEYFSLSVRARMTEKTKKRQQVRHVKLVPRQNPSNMTTYRKFSLFICIFALLTSWPSASHTISFLILHIHSVSPSFKVGPLFTLFVKI